MTSDRHKTVSGQQNKNLQTNDNYWLRTDDTDVMIKTKR